MDTRQAIRRSWQPRHPGAVLAAIKTIHTLAWFSIESCMTYLLYAGFTKRSDRRAALAAAVVGGECLIFAASGFRCPLTRLADSLGDGSGSVTDMYLPGWLAHYLPAIHAPLLVLAALLHGRNLRELRRREIGGVSFLGSPATNEMKIDGESSKRSRPTFTIYDAIAVQPERGQSI